MGRAVLDFSGTWRRNVQVEAALAMGSLTLRIPRAEQVVQRSAMGALLERRRPAIIVDCVNTATAFAYQNIFESAARLRRDAADGAVSPEGIERHLATLYLPQLIRHVQIALEAMRPGRYLIQMSDQDLAPLRFEIPSGTTGGYSSGVHKAKRRQPRAVGAPDGRVLRAEQAGAQIVVVAAGGKLADKANEKGYPLFAIPAGIQPRMATFYFVSAFLAIIRPLNITVEDVSELQSAGEWLRGQLGSFGAETPTSENYAKQLATKLIGKTVITYAGPLLFPAANKLKICMNENAKNTAWTNQYPEFNHNEFIGWSKQPVEKPYLVIDLRSNLEHLRVQKRFEVSERLLSGLRPSPEIVQAQGSNLLEQLLWTIAFGDFRGPCR